MQDFILQGAVSGLRIPWCLEDQIISGGTNLCFMDFCRMASTNGF